MVVPRLALFGFSSEFRFLMASRDSHFPVGAAKPFEDFCMNQRLYVGNLPFGVGDEDLKQAFGQFGEVVSARVITDRETGRSRGFGFVELASGGDVAVNEMNGADMQGRKLVVNEARERERTGGGGGGGGGGYGGGRGGGGGGRDRGDRGGRY